MGHGIQDNSVHCRCQMMMDQMRARSSAAEEMSHQMQQLDLQQIMQGIMQVAAILAMVASG